MIPGRHVIIISTVTVLLHNSVLLKYIDNLPCDLPSKIDYFG